MSLAWEVTVEDVAIVLNRHGVETYPDQVFDEHFVDDTDNCGRVEQAALAYTAFDEQCDAALDEIKVILTEVGILSS